LNKTTTKDKRVSKSGDLTPEIVLADINLLEFDFGDLGVDFYASGCFGCIYAFFLVCFYLDLAIPCGV